MAGSAEGLDAELAETLQSRSDLTDWLELVSCATTTELMPSEGQQVLAQLVRQSQQDGQPLVPSDLAQFAPSLGPRLRGFDRETQAEFEPLFVRTSRNRALLLQVVASATLRHKIAQQILQQCQRTEDRRRLLRRLHIAAVLEPECDAEQLRRIVRTHVVLDRLEYEGFISPAQMKDLTDDLRQRGAVALSILATPRTGAADNSPRLAKLYLALQEECEVFEHTNRVGNFGRTRAAYSEIERMLTEE
jgi:hypothetical protein